MRSLANSLSTALQRIPGLKNLFEIKFANSNNYITFEISKRGRNRVKGAQTIMAKIKTQAAQAAKELKKQLSVRFPAVAFSVKSENYSGGNSVNVYWSFGPSEKQVRELSTARQHGQFDGMTDMYNYHDAGAEVTESGEIKEVASAKYVFENRNTRYQDEKKTGKYYEPREDVLKMLAMIGEMWGFKPVDGGKDWQPEVWAGVEGTASNKFYRIAKECSFVSDNIELIEVKWVDYGYHNTFEPYTLIYKDLNTGEMHDAKVPAAKQ